MTNYARHDESTAHGSQSRGLDWLSPLSTVSKHDQFIRSIDWAATEIGPQAQWPQQLRQMVDLALADPIPAAVMWGDSLTMVYNEAFVEFAESKHPALMGKSPRTEYAEVWEPMFQPIIDRGHNTGQSTRHKNVCLFLHRRDYLEECHVTYTFVPLVGPNKTIVGFYHTALEVTAEVLSERRTRALLSIGDVTASSRTMADYWNNMIKAFGFIRDDLPYLIAYSFGEPGDHSASSAMSASAEARGITNCTLAGATGMHMGDIPLTLDFQDDENPLTRAARTSLRTGELTVLHDSDGKLPRWLFAADESRKYPERCRAAVVMPISPTATHDDFGQSSIGFVIVGINPRLEYDRSYAQFLQLCNRQMGTSAASIMMFVEEIDRQKRLAEKLLISSREAQELEQKFSRFSQLSNVAVWNAAPDGKFLQANEAWHQQTGISWSEEVTKDSWLMTMTDASRTVAEASWSTLIKERVPATCECQMRSKWNSQDAETGQQVQGDRWVLCTVFPELTEDGSLKSIWGCNSDISPQKYAEGLKEQRLADVLEAKRVSESFIDVTSHEMRNPLSAILQCADGITSTLEEIISAGAQSRSSVSLELATVESIADAAATIMTCAQHQKRIIDDILTLSKLDAKLLTIHRARTDPVVTAQHALKIHQREFEHANIAYELCIDDSYRSLDIQTVMLDQGRIMQVLINLITNAIKFTQPQTERKISLRLGASVQDPALEGGDVDYLDCRTTRSPLGPHPKVSDQGAVFVQFSVVDSGCGLTSEERERLFSKFSQGSPKTHTKFGGSGLGLFICKQLTELHGGRIGVSSTPGKGSCFKFYVQVFRTRQDVAPANISSRTPKRIDVISSNGATQNSHLTLKSNGLDLYDGRPPSSPSTLHRDHSEESLSKMHVLLVEDNLINQKVMASQLRKARCTVHIANHGVEALQIIEGSALARDHGPDAIPLNVVLMDLEMPVMNGLTCVAKIRELEKSGHLAIRVPVIAVTGNARSQHVEEAKATGMDEVVTKPFRIPDLLPVMRTLVHEASS